LVGVLEFLLLLLSAAAFLVFQLLGIPSFLAERNLSWSHSLIGKRILFGGEHVGQWLSVWLVN
jgi:hypothetical protein